MEEPTKQDTTVPEGRYIGVSCGECDRETRHKVLAATATHWAYENGAVDIWTHHQIVQCQGCLTISFRESSQCSEDWDIDQNTGEPYLPETTKLFPSRVTGRPVMSGAHHLPQGVYRIYQEAHGAHCAEFSILAGLGLRAIVEAVCKDQGLNEGNLQQKIDALADSGLITKAGARILHGLRFMGNAAAHETRAHSPQQIGAGFGVVEYLLQGVYVLPKESAVLPSGNES